MFTNLHTQGPLVMAKQLGEFLTRNLANPGLGWPLRPASRRREATARTENSSLSGLKVLIIGDLSLELPVDVAATRRQLLASLRAGAPNDSLPWTPSKPRAGGFAANAGRAAAALGAQVSVCTIVPVPMPGRFERFFEEHAV
ncbi:MAG: hypothetical protein ACYSVY_28710, partial [Planctomycetota bacterium]